MWRWIIMAMALGMPSCSDGGVKGENEKPYESYGDFQRALSSVYRGKPESFSNPYALMKNGVAGTDWLLTVHGLSDNLAVCEEIIAPYNKSPELSVLPGTYYCEEIDKNFRHE